MSNRNDAISELWAAISRWADLPPYRLSKIEAAASVQLAIDGYAREFHQKAMSASHIAYTGDQRQHFDAAVRRLEVLLGGVRGDAAVLVDLAADRIEHQRRVLVELASRKTASPWISVSDAMPPDRLFVLVKCPSGYTTIDSVITTARRHEEHRPGRWIDHAGDGLIDWGMEPTHWKTIDF